MLLPSTKWSYFLWSVPALIFLPVVRGSSLNSGSNNLSEPLPRVSCKSRVEGPLPTIVDCVPMLYHMSMGPGSFMPRVYRLGDNREWGGYSGIGYCRIQIYGGQTTVTYSDDDLLEIALWMIGKCYVPGNIDHVSEVVATLSSGHAWVLKFNMRLTTTTELQAIKDRKSQQSHGDPVVNGNATNIE